MPKTETTLLRLAMHLQGLRYGLTIEELQNTIGELKGGAPVTRRTVDKYREDLDKVFGELVTEEGTPLRVEVAAGSANRLISLTTDDIAELHRVSAEANHAGLTHRAERFTHMAERLTALLPREANRALDIDLPDLLAAEGYALRPGPRPKIQRQTLEKIRDAISGFRVISICYQARRDGVVRAQTVKPLGMIFGHRHYLVASGTSANKRSPHNYALSAIQKVEYTGEIFRRDEDFDIRSYAQRSFGIWQEEPSNVVLRFDARRAADVDEFFFHPTQTIDRLEDGRVDVRFTAGGLEEIAGHVFTFWSPDCEIVAPERLRELYRSMLTAALARL